ncbi:sugar-binding protein [Paenibacillus frigoriresistens]|uniref:sugar-binding protein n=1 Tax=Paenibacillus alginolyticus TaxID=59839 RepID=UPI0015638670|nr:sugar-binding protein [Paenibacillus frigoriresistens]NRF95673.1 sugar-binding protein [Paenibacillus frigoriresistens]
MKRKRSTWFSLVSVVLMVGLVTACSNAAGNPKATTEPNVQKSESTENPVKKTITIAVVPKALDNAIFLDAKEAAEKVGKELGIRIEWAGPLKSDASEQVTVVEGLIEKKVDGILISVNDADALKGVIDKATDKGIKVATFDSDSANSKRLFYAGTDNYGVGKQSAEFMKTLLPNGGKVAVLTGILGAPNLEQRIVGFKDGVKGSNIEVLPVQTGEDDVQKSVEVVNQFTAANPQLAGWFFDGGWPYFADPSALGEVKKFVDKGGKIVSIDTFYPMMKFVQLGMVDKLIGQDYTKMGDVGVRTLYKAIQGETITEKNMNTGSEVVDKNNVEEVLKTKKPWK